MRAVRFLVACDKFKGSLKSVEACEAVAAGLRRALPDVAIDRCPISDGGEGFVETMADALPGKWIEVAAHDALGVPIVARYLLTDDSTAVMEMAEASGLWRIAPCEREILRASTYGMGEMMRDAVVRHSAERIVIGLGGSATNDGGAGMAVALGVRFLDEAGNDLPPAPDVLARRLAACDMRGRIALPPVVAACDVTNPLLGPKGAARVYGPQKGADETSMLVLEKAMENLVAATHGEELAERSGAGAAGGTGFGLLRFAGAELQPGFPLVADLVGLEKRIAAADLVITGEGSLDAQSLDGKGPFGVASLARKHGRPVWAFCGSADEAARGSGWFDHIGELAGTGLPLEILLGNAAELLENLTTEHMAAWMKREAFPGRSIS